MRLEIRGILEKAGEDFLVTDHDLIRSCSEGMRCEDNHTQATVQDGDMILIGRRGLYMNSDSRHVLEESIGSEVTLIR